MLPRVGEQNQTGPFCTGNLNDAGAYGYLNLKNKLSLHNNHLFRLVGKL